MLASCNCAPQVRQAVLTSKHSCAQHQRCADALATLCSWSILLTLTADLDSTQSTRTDALACSAGCSAVTAKAHHTGTCQHQHTPTPHTATVTTRLELLKHTDTPKPDDTPKPTQLEGRKAVSHFTFEKR